MTFPLDNPALFGVGGCGGHQQAFGHRLGSGNGAPAWLPEGAVAGVDYTEGEAWLFDELVTDLATIHQGGFNASHVTAAGIAITNANGHVPDAAGLYQDVFLACDFCVLIDWDQLGYSTSTAYGVFVNAGENNGAANLIWARQRAAGWGATAGEVVWADLNNGQFNLVGVVVENTRNKIASSANAAGWLTSLNGATAILDPPVTPPLVDGPLYVELGHESGNNLLNGTIRRVIFYPNEQSAAEVEALSAL